MADTGNPALDALAARADLQAFSPDKAVMLYALELAFDVEDSASVAASALTDHSNDKSCDLVYVDRDAQRVVVAQGTWALAEKAEAPAKKAADLNQGVSWLIAGELATLPEALKSAAIELRDALNNDEIREFHIWMCHNLPESTNVQRELDQATTTAESLLQRHFPDANVERVTAREMGQETLKMLYEQSSSPILVSNEFTLPIPGGYLAEGANWRAFSTSVSGAWLREIWQAHETALMSPNVRDYLGIVRSERNINNGIKSTAREAADRFWIYNNGLTALVNDFELDDPQQPTQLTIRGIGIINGAQTTGALGTLNDEQAGALDSAQVMARFVACSDPDVLGDIIRFNNTQNKVAASDFRSTDAVQERLRAEFQSIPNSDYRGGRRGGAKDAIRRTPYLLADATVAQSLAAFHGEPNLAYNELRRIWEDDATYAKLFHEETTAEHIVFTFSLVKAIEGVKQELTSIPTEDRTAAQRRHIDFLSQRGSIALLTHVIAASLETITGGAIPRPWRLRFKDNRSPADGVEVWKPIVSSALAFSQQLAAGADNNLKNAANVMAVTSAFTGLMESTADSNEQKYQAFAGTVTHD